MSHPSRWSRMNATGMALLSCLIVPAVALGATLNGTVTDRTDGQPLLGATITVRPHSPSGQVLGIATDETGDYEITKIPPGDYHVLISFVGYSTETFELVVGSAGDQARQDAALTPRVVDLHTISVTASRRPEKLNDAPASVSAVGSEAVAERTTLTPTDHVSGLPAVDVARTGLNQTNMVTRGFNNIFSGALLVLVDNRLARVPSLRYNAYNFIPTANDDIERIEIVSGPGSALYGPNSAAGVMHIVTRSPFGSEGTTISVGGGERELGLGSFRHAGSVNNRIGYKITGQYYQGIDWKHREPSEPPQVIKFRPTPEGPDYAGETVSNARDFKTEKLSGEARVDFLIDENTSLIVNGGYNRGSGIELTGLSAAQAIDWGYSYFQARMRYKDLFVQGFVNASNAGDTYLLNTGQLIIDRSRVWAAQVQHSYQPDDRWLFTYGGDAILTRPNTDYTINGRNEDDDNIDEFGAYVQAESKLTDQFKLVGAARVDDHSRLEDLVFSPRAALVFQPNDYHSLRFTYNRAYATPDNNNLFLDIMSLADPFHTGIDLRVQGVPETGFHWRTDDAGPMFRSQFSPLIGGQLDDYYSLGVLSPQLTNAAWAAGIQLARGGLIETLTTPVSQGGPGLDPATAATIADAAVSVAPGTISPQGTIMRVLDLDTQQPILVGPDYVADIERLKPAITQTLELGYKGVLSDRLRFSIDAYRTKKHNFVGPLTVETPNIFMNIDPLGLAAEIGPAIGVAYATADPATQALLNQLDQNANGPVDELVAMFIEGGASTALGTVTPEEAMNPTDVMVTYRNFGDITYYGMDFSFAYHLNRHWDFGGSYSYVSKNFFPRDDDQVHDIHLNAPRNKFGAYVQYGHPTHRIEARARVRYVDAFNMVSPFLGSRVDSYILVDVNAGVNLLRNTRLNLTVQNVFDNRHIEFVGAPELGRMTIARITQTF